MSEYTVTLEKFAPTYPEMERIYRKHYAEMCERLESIGIKCSPYNPRLDEYVRASEGVGCCYLLLDKMARLSAIATSI